MISAAKFPHLALKHDEEVFITRLWQAMQASGHLLARAQVEACIAIVDASFAPKPTVAQQV